MKEVLPIEQAEAEVSAWLDRKKILPKRRERLSVSIDNLIEAVQYGIISINDDGSIVHTLQIPVTDNKGEMVCDKLTYKARIDTDSLLKAIAALKVNIADTQLMANIAELTGQPYGVITKMDPTDLTVAKSIGVFFMS
jgi:hypothetical protein